MAKQRSERREAKNFLSSVLMLIPNFLKLLYRLFKDPRVPLAEKALVVGSIVYIVSPLDLIPDFFPFIGQVDDLYLAALTILRLLTRTNPIILEEHWDGDGDVALIVHRIARAAQYVLPKKIRHVLMGRVEIAPQVKGGLLSSPAAAESIEDAREIEALRKKKA